MQGADNPGIVHQITNFLAESGLSVDSLETDQEIAPHGGTTLFRMRGVAVVTEPAPKQLDVEQIKLDLEDLGDSLNCQVSLTDKPEDEEVFGSFYAG